MKKGLHIVCVSGLVLVVSIAAIGCQKNTVETVPETTVPMTETIIELAGDESLERTTEADKETSGETKEKSNKKETEVKEDKKEALKDSKKETSKRNEKETSGKTTSQKETQKPVTGSNKPQKPAGTQKPSKPTETQKPSKPAETQKPSKPAETKPQEPQKPAETKPQHQHEWAAKTELITHPEEGHYETVVVKEAWDEPIYETKVVCGCGVIFNNDYEWEQHSLDGCVHGYSVQSVQVGSKHHDAVTEQKWVVDKKAWYESVIVGYECQCGETKK